jgi:hypothetical protein
MTMAERAPRRRENAPIRRPRPATVVPDFLFALSMTAWTMAIAFTVATFVSDDITAGDTGKILARVFSAALAISGLLLFFLGVMLLHDDRAYADHFTLPLLVGAAIGVIDAWLFLLPAGSWLPAPFVLLILLFRPVRRKLGRLLRRSP